MSVHEHVSPGRTSTEHGVAFFDTDESRADSLIAYLTEGYRRGEALIVILRSRGWSEIHAQLVAAGVPVDALLVEKRLLVLDAVETLEKLSNNVGPVPALFDSVVGARVRAIAAVRPVRAYCEMVDILAQRGDLTATVQLENLWNRLGDEVPLKLLCGYCSAHFVATATLAALAEICGAHDHVGVKSEDQLGAWLLANAGVLCG